MIKALVTLMQQTADRGNAEMGDQLLEQIEAAAERTNREVGGYWGYRCGALVQLARENRKYGHGLAQKIRKAKALYRNGRTSQAVVAYGEAAQEAHRLEQLQLAMELGYTRASLLLQDDYYEQAALAFHSLSESFPGSPRAAGAHLLWAYSLGKQYEKQPTQKRRQAYTDALTSIFNRRYFDQRYTREILRARRYKRNLSVLMIDIDHFKVYNDTFGHLMGDKVLQKVAQVLETELRRADVICRYGGEEFVVILPEIDLHNAYYVAEKLRNAVITSTFSGDDKMEARGSPFLWVSRLFPKTVIRKK